MQEYSFVHKIQAEASIWLKKIWVSRVRV